MLALSCIGLYWTVIKHVAATWLPQSDPSLCWSLFHNKTAQALLAFRYQNSRDCSMGEIFLWAKPDVSVTPVPSTKSVTTQQGSRSGIREATSAETPRQPFFTVQWTKSQPKDNNIKIGHNTPLREETGNTSMWVLYLRTSWWMTLQIVLT